MSLRLPALLPLPAGATTRLLRNSDQPEQQVASADTYLSVLQQGRIRCELWVAPAAAAAHLSHLMLSWMQPRDSGASVCGGALVASLIRLPPVHCASLTYLLPCPPSLAHFACPACSLGLEQRKEHIWREVQAAAHGVGGGCRCLPAAVALEHAGHHQPLEQGLAACAPAAPAPCLRVTAMNFALPCKYKQPSLPVLRRAVLCRAARLPLCRRDPRQHAARPAAGGVQPCGVAHCGAGEL